MISHLSFRAAPFLWLIIASLLALAPLVASADSVIRTGENISLAEDQLIEADFYSAAGKLNISGEVGQDVIAIASQVTINGSVGVDAFLVGGTVDVFGTVGDDLRIIAGEVTIAEPVMGDVLIIGGVVNILSSASISGDLILLAGQATVAGSVGGDILGRANDLRIDAAVAGSVDVTTFNLTLGEKAAITGSVEYVSRNLAVQALNASIGGDLVRSDPVLPTTDFNIQSMLYPVLILLFSVLVWYLVSKQTLTSVSQRALTKSFRPALIGCAVVLFSPLAIIILSISMLGLFVGIALFFAYGLLIILSMIAVSAVIGQMMMKLFSRSSAKVSLVSLVVGVIGVSLLLLLPLIGELVLAVFVILALGAMVDLLLRPSVK